MVSCVRRYLPARVALACVDLGCVSCGRCNVAISKDFWVRAPSQNGIRAPYHVCVWPLLCFYFTGHWLVERVSGVSRCRRASFSADHVDHDGVHDCPINNHIILCIELVSTGLVGDARPAISRGRRQEHQSWWEERSRFTLLEGREANAVVQVANAVVPALATGIYLRLLLYPHRVGGNLVPHTSYGSSRFQLLVSPAVVVFPSPLTTLAIAVCTTAFLIKIYSGVLFNNKNVSCEILAIAVCTTALLIKIYS